MTKPKQPPKNFFLYFVDEYILFRRDFVIDTTASVEECVHQLSQLSYEKRGCLSRQRISVYLTHSDMSAIRYFVIKAEEGTKAGKNQTARVEGGIQQVGDDITFITGKVLMPPWESLKLIGIFGVLLLLFGIIVRAGMLNSPLTPDTLKGWFMSGVVSLVMIYDWLSMYKDRNYLMNRVQYAISIAEMSAAKKNEPMTDLYDASSEYQSQHNNES
jgi:hypothetical protein